jgi:hypothetical protein
VNESTAPTVGAGNVTAWSEFSTVASYATGISVDINLHASGTTLDTGELIFVWIKRVIGAAASAASAVSFTVRIQGETAA